MSLHLIAIICLLIGAASALINTFDLLAEHPQQMWILNVVWPITGLYAGPFALWGYFTAGGLSSRRAVEEVKNFYRLRKRCDLQCRRTLPSFVRQDLRRDETIRTIPAAILATGAAAEQKLPSQSSFRIEVERSWAQLFGHSER